MRRTYANVIPVTRLGRLAIAVACLSFASLVSFCEKSNSFASGINFEDWTTKVGLNYQGETWGASWRDFDRDGYPDIFVSHHFTFPPGTKFSDVDRSPASLYRNLSGAQVDDLGKQLLGNRPGDWHGATLVDYDNDGDVDLFVSRGGNSGASKGTALTKQEKLLTENLFFVQEGGSFIDRGTELGLSLPHQRGRRSSWFDVDNDGRLDVFLGQAAPEDGGSILFLQRDSGFDPCLKAFPALGPGDNPNVILVFPGFGDDERYVQMGSEPGKLFRQRQNNGGCSFVPVPGSKDLARKGCVDILLADLDGDLALDLFAVSRTTVAALTKGKRYFRLELPWEADLTNFSFLAPGSSTLAVRPVQGPSGWWSPERSLIFIGSEGKGPSQYQFALDPNVADFWEAMDASLVPTGVFVHYDPKSFSWNIRVKKAQAKGVTIDVGSDQEIEIVHPPSIRRAPQWGAGVVAYTQGQRGWENAPKEMGFDTVKESCVSAVAEDFDNDRDVDLFLTCRDNAANRRNILLENRAGRFFEARFSGADSSKEGLVDSVSTGDFDRDGFPDLLITNGASLDRDPEGHGRVRLYHNRGNSNNWLRIELVGTRGPRDAIGSRVFVRAGGYTQLRYASGGIRATGQDESVLHFGLGAESTIEKILVEWPNGDLESFKAQAVTREVRLVQGQGTSIRTPVILVAKTIASVGESLRFLFLWPVRTNPGGIVWDIEGNRLKTTWRSFRHAFDTAGEKKITAYLNSASGEVVSCSTQVLIR